MPEKNSDIEEAKNILRGQQADPPHIFDLAMTLKKQKHFGYARQLLFRARQDPSATDQKLITRMRQQHALCTYKDPDLPSDSKLDHAFEILSQCEDLATTSDQETLGIAGAIFKNKWETLGQRGDLDRSLAYYLRGHSLGVKNDVGYTAINAAYVLDVLANEEWKQIAKANGDQAAPLARINQAKEIRRTVVNTLPGLTELPGKDYLNQEWWFHATMAEAHFGLQQYAEASIWLAKARNTPADDWEFESTARQLACLARLRGIPYKRGDTDPTSPWGVLREFIGDTDGVLTTYIGRVGLALSGGGFRASLFHIGVLARLAELDVLKHIEVLSCVSGGSIIGAQYYLELRRLLRDTPECSIKREHYIEIVRRLQTNFLAGVQKNIRTRVLANPWANIRMLLFPNASRTERVAELYEKHLFKRVLDGEQSEDRYINQLQIHPNGEPENFKPKDSNWRRSVKVPMLVLNATTLNTGHNWQFTSTWMGEPPAGIDSEIDGNYRLRRMYYDEAPEGYRTYRLGQAVAASSCVPGLFEPISLPNLFPDRTVRLVDGGVHDNQGIGALFDQGCSVLLVSDASGQMEAQNQPGNSALGAVLRSNSILQARVREAEFHELDARRSSSLLRGLMFIHLKKDLDVDPVDWVNCEDPFDASDDARPSFRRGDLTCYGLRKDVQSLLAGIRTDLDSFNEVEAFALMTSGYRMTEYELPRGVPTLPLSKDGAVEWEFLKVEEPMKRISGVDAAHREILTLLRVAGSMAFKIWKLSKPLTYLSYILFGVFIAAAAWACVRWKDVPLITPGRIGIMALGAIATALLGKTLVKVIRFKDSVKQIGVGIGMGFFGWVAAGIHLVVFDPMYLSRGKLSRVLPPEVTPRLTGPVTSSASPSVKSAQASSPGSQSPASSFGGK